MADFLLYNKESNEHYQKGDIIEVRPYGFFDNVGFNESVYVVIQVDDVVFRNVKHYCEAETYLVDDRHITIRNKRYIVDIEKLEKDIEKDKKIKLKMNKVDLRDKANG